jgi:hypothetical protein
MIAYRLAAFFGDPALWGACPPDLLRYFNLALGAIQ